MTEITMELKIEGVNDASTRYFICNFQYSILLFRHYDRKKKFQRYILYFLRDLLLPPLDSIIF